MFELVNFLVNMAEAMPPLRFLAQPRKSYRARYICEGRPCKHRAQRFVRADDNPEKYVYPTIEVKFFENFFFFLKLINLIFHIDSNGMD